MIQEPSASELNSDLDMMLLTPLQVAARLHVSHRTIRREIAEGKLPVRKVRGLPRIYWPDVLAAYQPVTTANPRRNSNGKPPFDMNAHLRHLAHNWNVVPHDEVTKARTKREREKGV